MEKNYIVELRVTHGSCEEVFNEMKELQYMGIADKRARIIFNDIKVPAGYLEEFEQFEYVYDRLLHDDVIDIVYGLPEGLDQLEINDIWEVCDKEKQKLGRKYYTYQDSIAFFKERYYGTQKVFQKNKK